MIQFPKKSVKHAVILFSLTVLSCVFVMTSQKTLAFSVLSDNEVYSILCDGVLAPDIQVVSPKSDSIVSDPRITLSGTTTRTTQIEVYINNVYSESLSVNPDGPFFTQATLNEGTNTIRLEAYFSCNHTTSSRSVVVTYEPQVTPSPGEDTDTNVPGGIEIPPTISSPGVPVKLVAKEQPSSSTERIIENLQFGGGNPETTSVYEEAIKPLAGWVVLGATIASLAVVVSPILLVAVVGKVFGVGVAHTVATFPKIFIRLGGIILVAVLLFLLQH
jgi:hypothetical protein